MESLALVVKSVTDIPILYHLSEEECHALLETCPCLLGTPHAAIQINENDMQFLIYWTWENARALNSILDEWWKFSVLQAFVLGGSMNEVNALRISIVCLSRHHQHTCTIPHNNPMQHTLLRRSRVDHKYCRMQRALEACGRMHWEEPMNKLEPKCCGRYTILVCY